MSNARSYKELILAIPFCLYGLVYGTYFLLCGILRQGFKFLKVKSRDLKPYILLGNNYGEHIFIRLKDSRMKFHCVVNGSKDKPLMLFLHGFPDFWFTWRYQIEEFRKNYYTVAVDMQGYGDSYKPQGVSNYTLEKLANEIDELICLLGYKSGIIVAHDWGGVVAWTLATINPERVTKLISINMGHPITFIELLKTSLRQLRKSWYIFFFQIPILPILMFRANDLKRFEYLYANISDSENIKSGISKEEVIEAYKYTFSEWDDLAIPLNYYKALLRYDINDIFLNRKISVPVHIIWGCQDVALERNLALLSEKHVEEFSYKFIEKAGHWANVEYPYEVNLSIEEFLSIK